MGVFISKKKIDFSYSVIIFTATHTSKNACQYNIKNIFQEIQEVKISRTLYLETHLGSSKKKETHLGNYRGVLHNFYLILGANHCKASG